MTGLERLKELLSEVYAKGITADFFVNDEKGCISLSLVSGSGFKMYFDLNPYIICERLSEQANYINVQATEIVNKIADGEMKRG